MRTVSDYLFFFTGACFLSNWYPSKFVVDDVTYLNGEQYIMKNKAITFGDTVAVEKIMECTHPWEMKRLGSKVNGFIQRVWMEKAPAIALKGLEQKFAQNYVLKAFLLDSGTKTIVEASPTDNLWEAA